METSLGNTATGVDQADPRWQLVERVIASGAFHKSARLRDLLCYLAERSIHDHRTELSEQRIGQAVFGKPADYSPTADSSVRVHIRQLRLKLHEYFDSEGRHEPLILEIPKGAYAPVFRSAEVAAELPAPLVLEQPRRWAIGMVAPWVLVAVLTTLCGWLWSRPRPASPEPTPWPLSALFGNGYRTQIVVADANYSMLRIMSQKSASLEEYLKPDFREGFKFAGIKERESRLLNYVNKSVLTSYADVAVVTNILKLVGADRSRITVRSAKDLRLRDLQDGNYIFLGSPTSNPWVMAFESRLNFQEVQDPIGGGPKFFLNKQPQAGEQASYYGLPTTGTTGEDYATISLLPTESRQGNVLIVQGLRQEGTEAAGIFLADESNRQRLRQVLGVAPNSRQPVYFELLLRTRAVSGSPSATSIVASRLLPR